MAMTCASPSCFITYLTVFVLLLPSSHSCPLLQRRLCGAANASRPTIGQCGDHPVRCSGSTSHIRFYGEGQWFPIREFSYQDRELVVQDDGVYRLLAHHDCGIVYSFPAPGLPLPRPIPFQRSLMFGFHTFNCEVGTFDFSKDAFARAYDSTGCTRFDLYYGYEPEGQPLKDVPPDCSDATDSYFKWRLRFDESGKNLSVLSAGISHQRKLRPECFSCRMWRRDCSPEALGNSTACSCDISRCTEASNINVAKRKIIIGVVAGIIGFLSLWLLLLYFCFRKKLHYLFRKWKLRNIKEVEDFLDKYGSFIPKRYDYSDVKQITNYFNKKLGHGGYGKVFKGKLPNGFLVAVKVLNESKGKGEEFVNEVGSIGKTYHVNVVRLLGFCSEGSRRALIYEYMPNGSLETFIFSTALRDLVRWRKLFEIAIGIARGLEYLHHGCNIVHFDIKPHNILLDEEFCPKISDFGLAKLCHPKESKLSMAGTRGTIGYIAPEVFSRNFGVISSKSDVYSYGMLLLEMVSGRRNADAGVQNISEVYFPHCAYEQLLNDGHLKISDITIETEEFATKMVIVGLWCIQTSPKSRPSMSNVVEMLEGSIEDLPMPPKPYLTSPVYSCYHSSS